MLLQEDRGYCILSLYVIVYYSRERSDLAVKRASLLTLVLLLAFMCVLSGCGGVPSVSEIQDALDPNTANEMYYEMDLTIQDNTIEVAGYYTGPLKDGVPDGDGVYIAYDDTENEVLSYRGEFSGGKLNGDGVLKLAGGEDNADIKYEGAFKENAFDGKGRLTVKFEKTEEPVIIKGTFTGGKYTPTTGEKYDYLGKRELYGLFVVPDNVIAYIDDHPELFPRAEDGVIVDEDLQDFVYKQFTKTRKQETLGLVKQELGVMSVYETEVEDIGAIVTYMLAFDIDENYYNLYYLGPEEV
ncbi:MAG: hypothetical protein IKT20_04345, partial [Clostridiales bacterium]|nr:hypothetical protein [Clostridiales bacterium]